MQKPHFEKKKKQKKDHIIIIQFAVCDHTVYEQAWEFRMEKSAEKWGSGGRRRPPVGVKGQS